MVEEMNLSTDPTPKGKRNLPLMHAKGPKPRTNEERRTLLGVWYMRSTAALVMKQLGPVSYTKYLNQCLKELEDAAEYETDQLAVQLVRIQQVTNKIMYFHGKDQLMDEVPGAPTVSATECLEAFQKDLEGLRNALPPNLKDDYVLSCHYNSAYLQLLEPLLAEAHLPDVVSRSLDSLSFSDLLHLNVFSRFTAVVKAWFDDWLAVPVCSYFYMPQPAFVQLIQAAWALTRWAKVAGPSAVRLSNFGTSGPPKEFTAPQEPIPEFNGIPMCPDLTLPQPPVAGVPAQTLDKFRTQFLAQPNLHVDIFGILDAMVVRFEAAKKEMAAAQGGLWENDTWGVAADHVKLKKGKIEKWCEIAARVANEGRSRPAEAPNGVDEGTGDVGDNSGGCSLDSFEWLMSGNLQDNRQWESDLFDGIMMDADIGAFLDLPNSWGPDGLDEGGLMGAPSAEGNAWN